MPVDIAAPTVTCLNDSIDHFQPETVIVGFGGPHAGTFTGSVEVTASNDTDPSNNNQQIEFEILPNVDVALVTPPRPPLAHGDVPLELQFAVTTTKYSVPDAVLQFQWSGRLDHFSASAPGATCGASVFGYRCVWSSLPANSVVPVRVLLGTTVTTSGMLSASLTSAADTNDSNNTGFLPFTIVIPGDVGVNVAQPALSLSLNDSFNVPGISIVTLARLESPFIELTFDQTRLVSMTVLNGFCTFLGQPLVCQVHGMDAPGTYNLNLQFVARGTGVVPLRIRVGASNDFNASNNERTVTFTITDPPAPPPPPPPPAPPAPPTSRGGGGGGSMSWLLAALLFAMWHHRRIRLHRSAPDLP